MPALKMKRNLSRTRVKGQSLHVCRKSTKASKGSRCEVKTSQQATVADNSIQSPLDVCSNIEVCGQNVEVNEANDCPDIPGGSSPPVLNLPSSSPSDPISSGRMGLVSVTCPSDLETIFSPNFEHDDSQFTMINNDAVRDEQTELPHLVADDSDDGSCTSSDFQSYSELDFYMSDNAAASPFDGDMGFTDVINSLCPDLERMNPDIMIDMTDRYMVLPFLEKTVETSRVLHDDSVEGAIMNSDEACLYLAIHQMKSDQETDIGCRLGDMEEIECIDQQLVFRSLPDLSEAVSSISPMWIPKETQERKPITLVLDLDETLVHSTLEHCNDADFTFPVFFNMKDHTVYVRRRPYLQMFLERVAQLFEVVIFTASQSIYAEQLLDILDPDRNLISQRIYRESCIFSDGSYTKDLTVLGVDLAKVAIIDNSPQVFQLQVNNGIPIESWFDDPSDRALVSLLPFLETLVDADDVRPIIAGRFNNKE